MPERRLYFMFRPPSPVAAAAAQLLCNPRLVRQAGRSAPMPPDRLHITLHPLGHFPDTIPQDQLDRARAIGAAIDDQPFDLGFDQLQSGGGRLVLKGHGQMLRKLCRFRSGLCDTMQRMGFPASQIKPTFTPHMTLDYAYPYEIPKPAIAAPIAWRTTELLLVISHYGQARHEVLERWPLTARQQEFSDW